ncbi:5,6-dimethylbenzimidazole synthase [Planotetraspora phitsanulokensis]|uniref:Nitroreductase domain-containing protein n=1 Tax=Planotetraspora phitsanulokensis TaxID=575192 RepID=A0A8J3UEN2_9ACTN|nr:nitroreductase family protein [Planotetraspora phitsanulokensis]GII41896.1 hypothetical protein Pph01_68990 [Planotetraspora phitsanulokensis]
MDVHEALYTTRMMRRMRPDPVPLETQCRILDAAIRAPSGGNAQRWHFLVVEDPKIKARLHEIYRRCRRLEYEDPASAALGKALHETGEDHAEAMRKIKASGDYFTDHFEEIPLLIFVFAVDDLGGANTYPAIWNAFLAARAEGVGGVMTLVLRYAEDEVTKLLGVPVEQGWRMTTMLAFGYPLGRWGVAANRRPVHEVASRDHWDQPFGVEIPDPLWSPQAGA